MRTIATVILLVIAGSSSDVGAADWTVSVDAMSAERARNVFKREIAFRVGHGGGPSPQLCVALSGGGMRSASFSIGVLAGLHAKGLLEEVDVISSASGGAYALSWYMAHHYRAWKCDPSANSCDPNAVPAFLFDRTGDHQKHLIRSAELIPHVGSTNFWTYLVGSTVILPIRVLANVVFGWHANLNPTRRLYETRLRNVFHQEPVPEAQYEEPMFGQHWLATREMASGPVESLTFADLRELLEDSQKRLPVPVINTTLATRHGWLPFDDRLDHSIFELTPFGFGSDAITAVRDGKEVLDGVPPVTLSRAVAISGAAMDRADLSFAAAMAAAPFNLDLGYELPNPWARPNAQTLRYVLPFPLHLLNGDAGGPTLRLSDGGHAENLALFSLVRRRCETTIVVDGEQDEGYDFDAYKRMRNGLCSAGVSLSVPTIDEALEAKEPESCLDCEGLMTELRAHPVMEGSIEGAKALEPGRAATPLRVVYVKLATPVSVEITRALYGDVVADYQDYSERWDCVRMNPACQPADEATPDGRRGCWRRNPWCTTFPHNSTTAQWFTPEKFDAYRTLGEGLGSIAAEVVRSPAPGR